MLKLYKVIFIAIIFLSLLPNVLSFGVKPEAVNDEILLIESEPIIYNITITNDLSKEDRFRIEVADFSLWSAQTKPLSHKLSGFKIPAHSVGSTTLFIYPQKDVRAGKYNIKLTIRSEATDQEVIKILFANLRSGVVPIRHYEPDIKLDIEIPNEGRFDPRQGQVIKVNLKNKNALDIKDLSIKISSSLLSKSRENITLAPLESKSENFAFTFDSKEKPQQDTLLTTVSVGNKTFVSMDNFEIMPYYLPFEKSEKVNKSFLKSQRIIKITNPSNAVQSEVIKVKAGFFKRIFITTYPPAKVIEEKAVKYLAWDLELEPFSSEELLLTSNYRPLLYIVIIIIFGVILYFFLRSDIIITKKVSSFKTRHGGISELKVIMNIRNRSRKQLEHLSLIDRVPNIVEFVEETHVGTLKPSKVVKQDKKSTKIFWKIKSLDSGEEQIISYSIKSKLSILGKFNLPAAKLKYKKESGKQVIVKSNILRMDSYIEEQEEQ